VKRARGQGVAPKRARCAVSCWQSMSATPHVFIFDKAFKAKEEAALFGTLKTRLATFETQYLIYFQNVSKDLNAQIADYVAWANFVCFERENAYWKNLLPERLSTHHFLEVHP
jgi:hypothetical protein